jgi:hypothetical protein
MLAAILGIVVILILLYENGSILPTSIAGYAQNAGFSGGDLLIATAIAYAESSGNPGAVGDNGDSIGLWQINLPNHPEFQGQDLTNPQVNANAAFSIYSAAGNSFSPWTTFKTGAYLQDQYQTPAQNDVYGLSGNDDSEDDEDS